MTRKPRRHALSVPVRSGSEVGFPQSLGEVHDMLYDKSLERDNCGFGLIAHIEGEPSHKVVRTAIHALARMQHRGAILADGKTGDGCGLLLQKPDRFFRIVAQERGLLAPITDVVKRGALYIGWSAGANLACPTIRTTNDMPIVDPQGFDALNLFPLQINPHFTNALPEGHKGETREQRIRELLVVAPELTIIGLPEGNWITVSKGHATLGGPNTTYVFKAGEEAVPLEAGHRF